MQGRGGRIAGHSVFGALPGVVPRSETKEEDSNVFFAVQTGNGLMGKRHNRSPTRKTGSVCEGEKY